MHLDQAPKKYLKDNLGKLKREYGYNVLALEMLNSKSQPYLDKYMRDEINIQKISDLLDREWRYPTNYVPLIKKAKELGFHLLAVDDRTYPNANLSENIKNRDKHWVNVIKKYSQRNKESKIVLLAGKLHALKSFSKKNIEVKTVIEQLEQSTHLKGQSIIFDTPNIYSYYESLVYDFNLEKGRHFYVSKEIEPYTSAIIFDIKEEN